MEKSLFEQMGGTYYQEGDYLLPNLALPERVSIQRYKINFLKSYHFRAIRATITMKIYINK